MARQRRPMLVRAITNSERTCFACEKAWAFRYLDGLTSFDSAAPLRMGSLFHHALATYYRNIRDEDTGSFRTWYEDFTRLINETVIEPWLEKRHAWAQEHLVGESLEAIMHEDSELAALTGIMFGGHVAHWHRADYEHLEIVAIEPQVARWIPHPTRPGAFIEDRPTIKGEKRRRRWCYAGALDLVLRDRRNGLAWFMEHKTTVERDLENYTGKLHWDPQIRGYAWALRDPIPELSDIKEPLEVAGVIYNVARKKAPSLPVPLVKCARCGHPRSKHPDDGSECEGSKGCDCTLNSWRSSGLSTAEIDTTYEVFKGVIEQYGFNPDDYRDALERARDNVFFARQSYPITSRELEEWGTEIGHVALRMLAASKPGAYHPRQPSVCTGIAALACEYNAPCIEDGNMVRAAFTVKSIRHAELTGDLAEPYVAQERGLTILGEGSAAQAQKLEDANGLLEDVDPWRALVG